MVGRWNALTRSTWVRREVDRFAKRGSLPIVIDADDIVERSLGGEIPRGSLLEWVRERDVLRLKEVGLERAAPEPDTVARLAASFEGQRVRTRRERAVAATLAVLAVLLLIAVALGFVSEARRQAANAQRERVELELSRADARQALLHLRDGRDDAAALFLARSLASHPTELAAAVRHLLTDPRYAVTRRAQLPQPGAVARAWTDPAGNFLAVQQGEEAVVRVYAWDHGGLALRATVPLKPYEPTFMLHDGAHPVVAGVERPDDDPTSGAVLTVRRLDAPDPPALREPIKLGSYQSLATLSDGRIYFANGPELIA